MARVQLPYAVNLRVCVLLGSDAAALYSELVCVCVCVCARARACFLARVHLPYAVS
jgi:hypothetical protein